MENATLKMSHQRMIEEVETLSRKLPINRGAIRTLTPSPAGSPTTKSVSSSSPSPYASPASQRGRGGAQPSPLRRPEPAGRGGRG